MDVCVLKLKYEIKIKTKKKEETVEHFVFTFGFCMSAACPEMHQTRLHSWMLKGLRNIMATFGIATMGAGCVVMMILEKFAVFS